VPGPASLPWNPAAAIEGMRRLLRLRNYSPRTERSYVGWASRFFRYLERTASAPPTSADVKAYLSFLATRRKVSASTQSQAFNALLFLFRYVLQTDLGDMSATVRAKRGQKVPVVLSRKRHAIY
jgi:site-specific recombinase XerD